MTPNATSVPPATDPVKSNDDGNVKLRTLYQFPNGTWIENIAVRSNGKLLVTLLSAPELWEIDPFATTAESTATLVHRFENARMLFGITELTEGVFAVAVDQTVQRIDLRDDEPVSVSAIVHVAAGLFNGMATLNSQAGTVLVADSFLGAVWLVDLNGLTSRIVLEDDTMKPQPGPHDKIGINGLKVLDDYVHYTNTPGKLLCRVQIDCHTGQAIGPYGILAREVSADDFAISSDGTAYVAGLDDNVLTRVHTDGKTEIIAGSVGSAALAGDTSAAFGRTAVDRNVLYVTTSGAVTAPVNGTFVEGGKVVAVYL